jgi:hypothetical protein
MDMSTVRHPASGARAVRTPILTDRLCTVDRVTFQR